MSKPKFVVITGGTGWVGQYLTKELIQSGYNVFSVGRKEANLLDYEEIHSLLRNTKPDIIFHLAAIALVPTSWKDPKLVLEVNTIGSLNLFNAIRSVGIDPVIQIACSSEEYGLVKEEELPITEEQPLRPLSPYAVSKVAMDLLGYQFFKSYGMKIIRTRAFNHAGYGRPEQYVTSTFAKQIVEIEKKKRGNIIYHGDLTTRRDITDVRDIAVAYRLAVEKCEPGEVYNIGSGNTFSVEEILDTLIDLAKVKVKKELDKDRIRPSDVPVLSCDNSKFKKQTSWQPKYSLEETLSEELRFWRERI